MITVKHFIDLAIGLIINGGAIWMIQHLVRSYDKIKAYYAEQKKLGFGVTYSMYSHPFWAIILVTVAVLFLLLEGIDFVRSA